MVVRGKRQVDEARLRKLEARRRELDDELRELERADCGVQLKNQPASMLPGGVTYVTGMTTGRVGFAPANTAARLRLLQERSDIQQELTKAQARSEANAARLRHKRIEQSLNTLLARTTAPVAATETAVIPPPPARIKEAERVAEALRVLFPPHGIVPRGMVWDSVNRMLRKHDVITSERTYWRALKLNRERAKPVPAGVPGLAR
jgi:hypothetical protein